MKSKKGEFLNKKTIDNLHLTPMSSELISLLQKKNSHKNIHKIYFELMKN